ncbi:hypothetical protein DICPUDRAFT_81666 [Dictyostelium purpureum]|uniref:Uncharacterized protein n=1 Tax=Dictyostelium purpureum TaxID=5786 RepID=F0ZU73_DICPU|nr:uncharacterized protein DICPUDRAFT_81666 [Dictyostelium purpureum]EGC32508.1 hypothetical protein DICPUDRAFT_81666 [Dictyostelium purpureum]|eukprot:XP_003290958.1 hypothetical protein DICPUDRAFT_81666 [Dictyostelium purpureum]
MKFLLFLLFLVNYSIAEDCGFPSGNNVTTAPFNQYVKITRCEKYYDHPGYEPCYILFKGDMNMGDYFADSRTVNNNTFQYMGGGKVCYSVYKDIGECSFRNAIKGCEKYCVYNYTVINFETIYDYFSCNPKVEMKYYIQYEISYPSSSNRTMCSMLSLLLVFIVGLLL